MFESRGHDDYLLTHTQTLTHTSHSSYLHLSLSLSFLSFFISTPHSFSSFPLVSSSLEGVQFLFCALKGSDVIIFLNVCKTK